MNINERHQHILEKLKKDGKVNIFELQEEMGVSGVTIRKDLKLLEDKHLMFRIRGGRVDQQSVCGRQADR